MENELLRELEQKIGYQFKDKGLLKHAMSHSSYANERHMGKLKSNERLEFLGDSLLNCVTAINLYERYVDLNEGNLSRLRSSLVRQQALYEIAQKLDMSSFLRLGEGELKAGGFKRPSILADAMEALFGAIFLDSDFETVRRVITQLFTDMVKGLDPETFGKDAKTQLQEYLQGHKLALPEYQVVATHGAAHNQEFEIECTIGKFGIHVFGTGSSRRAGEQEAAQKALVAVEEAMKNKKQVSSGKKGRKEAQMKLIGIATPQRELPVEDEAVPPTRK